MLWKFEGTTQVECNSTPWIYIWKTNADKQNHKNTECNQNNDAVAQSSLVAIFSATQSLLLFIS